MLIQPEFAFECLTWIFLLVVDFPPTQCIMETGCCWDPYSAISPILSKFHRGEGGDGHYPIGGSLELKRESPWNGFKNLRGFGEIWHQVVEECLKKLFLIFAGDYICLFSRDYIFIYLFIYIYLHTYTYPHFLAMLGTAMDWIHCYPWCRFTWYTHIYMYILWICVRDGGCIRNLMFFMVSGDGEGEKITLQNIQVWVLNQKCWYPKMDGL